MDDGTALLAAACAAPHDDTPRLVYADFLEENGEPDRAEFVRLQIRIARVRAECGCGACVNLRGGGRHGNGPCAVDRERDELPDGRSRQSLLRRWERELLFPGGKARHHREWFPDFADDWLFKLERDTGGYPGRKVARVGRGFVSAVTLSAADWLAHERSLYWRPGLTDECPACKGDGDFGRGWFPEPWPKCNPCSGTGRVPRPCPPSAQPVTAVRLTTAPPLVWDVGPMTCRWEGSARVVTQSQVMAAHVTRVAGTPRTGIVFTREDVLSAMWEGIAFELPADGRFEDFTEYAAITGQIVGREILRRYGADGG